MGGNEEGFESSMFFETQKCYFVLESRLFFSNGHIRNVVSTLSNVVQFDVEIHVFSTLLNIVNYNVDVHNLVWMLIWRCATLRRHINLKTTLNQRWNVCWNITWSCDVYKSYYLLLWTSYSHQIWTAVRAAGEKFIEHSRRMPVPSILCDQMTLKKIHISCCGCTKVIIFGQQVHLLRRSFLIYLGFLSQTIMIHMTAEKEEAIYLTPFYHFHPLHRHLNITRVTTAESLPLCIASTGTQSGNLWFLSKCC